MRLTSFTWENVDYDLDNCKTDFYKSVLWKIQKILSFFRLTDLENKLMVTKGERWGGGINWEFGTDMYTLLYLK